VCNKAKKHEEYLTISECMQNWNLGRGFRSINGRYVRLITQVMNQPKYFPESYINTGVILNMQEGGIMRYVHTLLWNFGNAKLNHSNTY
jgi:hypothetical protein